ncbi:MAG: DUF1570 domain-containing protein [Opitutaceae bacterium]|nr:DUF1570 domain-containing protein [Opitutaceae bacterium]
MAAPLRAAEAWVKVVTEHATILTPARETVARQWAIEFEQFRRGLQSIVPVAPDRLRPVTIVLFKSDRAMEPYLPLENGRPAKLGGYFVRTSDLNAIMLSLAHDDAATRRVIFHEAVHWHLSAREGAMPLWLDEGLAEVYATFEVPDARSYAFGAAIPEHVALLRAERLLPLPVLLGVGRESLLYNEGTRAGIFYAQAWAFVHFLLYGDGSPGPGSVGRYLELVPALHSADDAFTAAFGADYATMERRLRHYIGGGTYKKHTYLRATADIARTLRTGPAAPADLALARGVLLHGTRSAEEAEKHFGEAALLAPEDPRAWEQLGQIAMARQDFSAAQPLLARAVAAGSRSHLVYHNLAVARLPELAGPRMPGAAASGEAMEAAAADFRRALSLAPAHVPSYESLAGLMHSLPTPLAADLELLARGAALAPESTLIQAGLAAGELRLGRAEAGRARLERLRAARPDGTDRGTVFARGIWESERLRAESELINRLIEERRFEDVIPIIDRALARGMEPVSRQAMESLRRRMAGFQAIKRATQLANEGDLVTARGLLADLLASGSDQMAEVEARRLLRELDKHEARRKP